MRFSLAGTASWLVRDLPTTAMATAGAPARDYRPEPWLRETQSGYGRLRYAASPLGVGARGDGAWSVGPSRWGTDRPVWL